MGASSHAFSASPATEYHEVLPYGHYVRYEFSLYNAAALEEWTFTQNYIVDCKTSTSWRFTLRLYRGVISGKVFGEAVLKRLDSLPNFVDAYFVLTFENRDLILDFVPTQETGGMQRVGTGEVLSTFIGSIVPVNMSDLLRGQILGRIKISIRNCHENRIGSVPTGDKSGAGSEKS